MVTPVVVVAMLGGGVVAMAVVVVSVAVEPVQADTSASIAIKRNLSRTESGCHGEAIGGSFQEPPMEAPLR